MSPRRPLFLLCCLALLALVPSTASAESLRLDAPLTDNYKAGYNADPSEPELRTWLSLEAIGAAGTTWEPVRGSQISVVAPSTEVVGADGRRARLTARISSGPGATLFARVDHYAADSGGRWGLLLGLRDRAALRSAPVELAFELASDGVVLATGAAAYRFDAELASVDAGHVEFNGPGGRWHVGGLATRTEWEPATEATQSMMATPMAAGAPRITRVVLPARTSRRMVVLRVFGRAAGARITHVRVAIDGQGFGRWVRTAAAYRLTLPAGRRSRLVRVQVRDASGMVSRVAARRITCSC